MARKEERWCYFDGAKGHRRSTWISLLLVILCALLAGSLAVAEHGECLRRVYLYVCMCVCARARLYKCHLHICVYIRRGERAHGYLSITCCVSRRILFEASGEGSSETAVALAEGRETVR